MSRIGKKPVAIPTGVQVALKEGELTVKGPKGELKRPVVVGVGFSVEADQVIVQSADESNESRAYQGLMRALLGNMVDGVTRGFERILEINGVGYRAELKGNTLSLALGYSHGIDYPLPDGISAEVEKQTKIFVRGIDKELVGATAAKIRSFRPPEPYKGKGIKYSDERILRKAGKTGKK